MAADWVRQVLVVEDDPFVRGLVERVLVDAGFGVAAAEDAAAALTSIDAVDPDAAVLDIELGPGPSGIDLAEVLKQRHPHIALVFLTQAAGPDVGGRPARIPEGAAYLVKRSLADPATLVDALEHVLADGDPRGAYRADRERTDPLRLLSPAQRDTLRMIAEGLSNEEIARQRATSVRAVEAMVSRVFAILGVSGDSRLSARVAATRVYAAHAGLPTVATRRAT